MRLKTTAKGLSKIALSCVCAMTVIACAPSDDSITADADTADQVEATTMQSGDNPFMQASDLYLQYPAFDKIENAHYMPAFKAGLAEQVAEIDVIANSEEAPTFENTFVAMERSGAILDRVARVFYARVSAHTNDEVDEIRTELAPMLSAHGDEILLNSKLFARVKAVNDQLDDLELDAESKRLVSETYKDFIGAGAQLSDEDKEKLKAMNSELASLGTEFSKKVLDEVNDNAIVVDSADELVGMSEVAIASALEAGKARELKASMYCLCLIRANNLLWLLLRTVNYAKEF